jgi:DNA polymerase-3 subunit alpha
VTDGKDQLVAGIIISSRMLMGQRGRMMIATIDDGTTALELTLYSEVCEPNRSWLKEDELLIAKVNVSPDKFSGGLRVVAESVWILLVHVYALPEMYTSISIRASI